MTERITLTGKKILDSQTRIEEGEGTTQKLLDIVMNTPKEIDQWIAVSFKIAAGANETTVVGTLQTIDENAIEVRTDVDIPLSFVAPTKLVDGNIKWQIIG